MNQHPFTSSRSTTSMLSMLSLPPVAGVPIPVSFRNQGPVVIPVTEEICAYCTHNMHTSASRDSDPRNYPFPPHPPSLPHPPLNPSAVVPASPATTSTITCTCRQCVTRRMSSSQRQCGHYGYGSNCTVTRAVDDCQDHDGADLPNWSTPRSVLRSGRVKQKEASTVISPDNEKGQRRSDSHPSSSQVQMFQKLAATTMSAPSSSLPPSLTSSTSTCPLDCLQCDTGEGYSHSETCSLQPLPPSSTQSSEQTEKIRPRIPISMLVHPDPSPETMTMTERNQNRMGRSDSDDHKENDDEAMDICHSSPLGSTITTTSPCSSQDVEMMPVYEPLMSLAVAATAIVEGRLEGENRGERSRTTLRSIAGPITSQSRSSQEQSTQSYPGLGNDDVDMSVEVEDEETLQTKEVLSRLSAGDVSARRTFSNIPNPPWRQNGSTPPSVGSRRSAQSCEVGVGPSEGVDATPSVGHRFRRRNAQVDARNLPLFRGRDTETRTRMGRSDNGSDSRGVGHDETSGNDDSVAHDHCRSNTPPRTIVLEETDRIWNPFPDGLPPRRRFLKHLRTYINEADLPSNKTTIKMRTDADLPIDLAVMPSWVQSATIPLDFNDPRVAVRTVPHLTSPSSRSVMSPPDPPPPPSRSASDLPRLHPETVPSLSSENPEKYCGFEAYVHALEDEYNRQARDGGTP
ncbi:hypothetical protein K435DRAFT_444832 [Dendrothele bispora CBS 962.96]|uniref:Uncharacterized protein n=1 Tax=Dendrothele bispora (strain CBS 962.96) TaxID=1314807 RepID=A0A4S8L2X7_DENBC|nr:hypothetical protein K435DRAFT_444832 [Dendrothele bispora CBS 962.96]